MGNPKLRLLVLTESDELGGIFLRALPGFVIERCRTSQEADDAFRRNCFDLALLDLSSAFWHVGFDLIRDWRREEGAMPIIVISDIKHPLAAAEVLRAGADDFLRKPFHYEELRARMDRLAARGAGAVARKAGGVILSRSGFTFGEAEVTPNLTLRFPDGAEERVRAKQFGILKVFSDHAGELVLKEELIRQVWGSDAPAHCNSVNEYISMLRRSYSQHGLDLSRWVTSEPKAGWRIHPGASTRSSAEAA